MTNLKAVKEGFNKFCGPAVLSIVTGKNTDVCARAISEVNGQYKVEGVYLKDLKKALEKLGFKSDEVPFIGRSLYSALVSIAAYNGIYIVQLETHYVCVEIQDKKIFFCDNHTKEPMPAASSARLMNGVVSISKVEIKPKPALLPAKFKKANFIRIVCEYCGGQSVLLDEEEMTFNLCDEVTHRLGCEYWSAIEANREN